MCLKISISIYIVESFVEIRKTSEKTNDFKDVLTQESAENVNTWCFIC